MKVSKCLFPVGGYGTRFLPATKAIPKEMLPILSKPLIQYGVEEAMSANLNSMAMVTNINKKSIQNYFESHAAIEKIIQGTSKENLLDEVNNISKQCSFNYVDQEEMLGLGHAIFKGKSLIGNESFAVILPDDLCINENKSVLSQMMDVYEKYPDCCIIAIQEVLKTEVSSYGIIEGALIKGSSNTFRVTNMVEKPSITETVSNLAIIGRYILTPEIFDVLEYTKPDSNGEVQITNALMKLAKQGKVIAYKFKGQRFDCGSVKGFISAINYFGRSEGFL